MLLGWRAVAALLLRRRAITTLLRGAAIPTLLRGVLLLAVALLLAAVLLLAAILLLPLGRILLIPLRKLPKRLLRSCIRTPGGLYSWTTLPP